jgi:hypothetical protein
VTGQVVVLYSSAPPMHTPLKVLPCDAKHGVVFGVHAA